MPQQSQFASLDEAQANALRTEAAKAAKHAYAPYSHFHVGAALLLEGGQVITGCNVENASYRLTTCAEQAAIARAVSELGPDIRIVAVAVANEDATIACQPCGACRQTIAEFAAPTCHIFFPADGGKPGECTLADLLPASFTSQHLQNASK